MKFTVKIKHRWSAIILFSAEIEAPADASEAIKTGMAVKEAVKSNANLSGADLRDAVLSRADLRGADLSGAVLSDAVLSGADLSGADLHDADLSGAVLSGAVLRRADLRDADLSDAVLRGAVLSDAVLRGANLRGANLSDADLRRADLSDANLSDAVLRAFKADFWSILLQNKPEVPGLIAALREGRVDGSTYTGACACLVGTIANVRGVPVSNLERDSSRPAEQWFLMIQKGDKPGDDTGGGFAAQKAIEWAEEFCDYVGITLADPVSA